MSESKPTGYLEQILGVNRGKKVPLFNFDVILGRSKNAYISSQDPNVSRCHCALKYSSNGWLIKDLKSVNGTYVDNIRIPCEYVPLKSGSSIYFGPGEDAPEGYRFEAAESLNQLRHLENDEFRLRSLDIQLHPETSQNKSLKRKVSSCADKKHNDVPHGSNHNQINSNDDNCVEDGYHSDSSISSLDSLKTRIRKTKSAEKKKEKRQRVCCKDDDINVPSSSKKLLFNEGNSLDRLLFQMKPEDNDSQSLLNEEHVGDWNLDDINYKKPDLENNISIKNLPCFDDLNSNSVAVHSDLLKTLEKKVNDLQKTLKTVNLKFSDTLNENARLIELAKSKEQSELKLKEDVLKITEEDLICNICTEIFIKPITLGCSHTFCHYCIFEWKKKKRQCPICRERIETETTVLYMDNYINKIVALLDPRSLEKRLELIKSRDQTMQKKPKRKKSKRNSGRRSVSRGVTSVSGVASRMERIQEQIIDIASYANNIRNYVDVMDEVMLEDDDEDDEIQEIGGYYGGYGMCYNCGRSGHWANGCPY